VETNKTKQRIMFGLAY